MSGHQFARRGRESSFLEVDSHNFKKVCTHSLSGFAPFDLSDLHTYTPLHYDLHLSADRSSLARTTQRCQQDLSLTSSRSHIYQPISRSLLSEFSIEIVLSQSCKVWSVGRLPSAPYSSHRLYRHQDLFAHPCEGRIQKPRTPENPARIPHQPGPLGRTSLGFFSLYIYLYTCLSHCSFSNCEFVLWK